MSRLLERAAQGFQYFRMIFCISQSSLLPNVTQAQFVCHQPPFLLSCKASIMKFNSCESAIAFINPRIHAGHTKLHDPINDHMTNHSSDSVICEFSATWLLCLQLFFVVTGCHCLLLIWNLVLEMAKDGYWHLIMSHHDFHVLFSTDIWWVLNVWIIVMLLVMVSSLQVAANILKGCICKQDKYVGPCVSLDVQLQVLFTEQHFSKSASTLINLKQFLQWSLYG
jgi:hypothetical protein